MSQLTTHILDTTKGRPASGITIILYRGENDTWTEIARGITNADGRIGDLLKEEGGHMVHCIHKIRFETKDYFDRQQVITFYPYVEIIFDVTADEHYHVPLLMNPFGFSTYRGS